MDPVPRRIDETVWEALTDPNAQKALLKLAQRQGFMGDGLEQLAQALTSSPEFQTRLVEAMQVDITALT